MVKHIQKLCVFDHFVGLPLKNLTPKMYFGFFDE